MDFLNKKSWHPSKLANVEKVWKREQEAEAERKKMLELKRKLIEERQIEELRKVQDSNLRSKYVLHGPTRSPNTHRHSPSIYNFFILKCRDQTSLSSSRDTFYCFFLKHQVGRVQINKINKLKNILCTGFICFLFLFVC